MAVVYGRNTLHGPLMAQLFVEGAGDGEGTEARAIVDTGADASCILLRFARDVLRLRVHKNKPIRMLGPAAKAEPCDVPWYKVRFTVVTPDGAACARLSDALEMPSLVDIPMRSLPGDSGKDGVKDQVKLILGMDFLRKVHFGYCPPEHSVFWLSSTYYSPRQVENGG